MPPRRPASILARSLRALGLLAYGASMAIGMGVYGIVRVTSWGVRRLRNQRARQ